MGPTDTPATATDSTGHTDTVHTTVDMGDTMDMDTEPTDIPTSDKDIVARFLSAEILPKCVQRANLEMLNLICQRVLKPKRSLKIKHLLGLFRKKKKGKKKKIVLGFYKKKKKKKKK